MKLPLLCLPLVSSRPQQLIHAAAHIYRLVYVQPAMWLLRHGDKGVVLTLLALLRHETVQKRLVYRSHHVLCTSLDGRRWYTPPEETHPYNP
jgi:hypothetical protein